MEWMFGAATGVGLLVYIAFVFDVAGFLARDELWLRLLMLTASGFYLVYYYIVADVPLWDALLTNGILALVNLAMIGVVLIERSTLGMRAETAALYAQFPLLTPGQFRRLMRNARDVTVPSETELVREGQRPDHLYFVVAGGMSLEKSGQAAEVEDGSFIGEIAYFTKVPATATIRLAPGARYLSWSHDALDTLFRRTPSLRAAIVGHLNGDLARKVAISLPLPAPLRHRRPGEAAS